MEEPRWTTGLLTHSPLASPLQHPVSQSHTPVLQETLSAKVHKGAGIKQGKIGSLAELVKGRLEDFINIRLRSITFIQ